MSECGLRAYRPRADKLGVRRLRKRHTEHPYVQTVPRLSKFYFYYYFISFFLLQRSYPAARRQWLLEHAPCSIFAMFIISSCLGFSFLLATCAFCCGFFGFVVVFIFCYFFFEQVLLYFEATCLSEEVSTTPCSSPLPVRRVWNVPARPFLALLLKHCVHFSSFQKHGLH